MNFYPRNDSSSDRTLHYNTILKIAASLCCLSTALQFHRFSSTSFSYFYNYLGYSEYFCNQLDLFFIGAMTVTAVSVWFKSVIASIFCILGSLVFLTEAVAQTIYPPEMTAIFTFVSHSIRFILPIYIVVLHSTKGVERLNLLSIAIACTFCGHGLQALYEAPPFLDYLLAFFYDINIPIEQRSGIRLLHVIGVIDIVVACHVIFQSWNRLKWYLGFMATWGFISAMARVTFSGWGAWHEITLRAPHFLVPIALLLFVIQMDSKRCVSK